MEQEKIWKHFQNHGDDAGLAFSARVRYEAVALLIPASARVLNIGVGRGGLEKLLLEKGARVSCLDPDQQSISRIRDEFGLGDAARVGYIQSIPFDDKHFDVVVVSEVLEHLTSPVLDSALMEISRVLVENGHIVGSVPADERLRDSEVVCPACGIQFHRWGHVQSFTQSRLHQALSSRFTAINISRKYLGDPRALNWKGKISWAAKQIALSLGIKGQGETFVFKAARL